jgi:hypothetical protein
LLCVLATSTACALAIGCSDGAGPQQSGPGVINLNSATTFQTISGWEATDGLGQLDFPQTFTAWRDAAIDSAAALGINRIRLAIPSGSEIDVDYFTQYATGTIPRSSWGPHRYSPVNDNGDPNVINAAGFHFSQVDLAVDNVVNPLRQRLAARGETLYVNLSFVHGQTGPSLHRNSPAEYAELMLAAFQHLDTKYGWTPDGVELILEPDALTDWNGTEIGQVLVAAGQRLSAAGYTPEFIGPSTTGMSDAVPRFDAMMAVTGASQFISELSYHRYRNNSTGALQTIVGRASQRGIGTSMLEHIGSGYQDLLEDLVVGMNRSWQQFTIAFPTNSDNGAQLFLVNSSNNAVSLGSRTKFLGQIFRYVRRQAVRIAASSVDTSLAPVAFINADGSYVVVVDASAGKEFSVSGLPAGTYGVTYTTTSAYGVAQPDVTIGSGGLLVTSIPQAGLLTIFKR